MSLFPLKPTSVHLKRYYAALQQFQQHGHTTEGNTRAMQLEFMNEGNSERVRRQKKAPIRVVIGNPPYNMGQVNENDRKRTANTATWTSG